MAHGSPTLTMPTISKSAKQLKVQRAREQHLWHPHNDLVDPTHNTPSERARCE